METYQDPPLRVSDDAVKDIVTGRLIERGHEVRLARLNPKPYSKVIGFVVDDFAGARITYRVESKGRWLRMIFYEANCRSESLRNSFRGFAEFLDFLVLESTGIERLYGAIHEMRSDLGRDLATERIAAFYKRILCGRTLEWRDGQEIIYTEMCWWKDFRSLDAPADVAA
ncbi:MAG: hypothetical protein AAGA96_11790 [Verrucomicrobiota bacterium]